VIPVAEDQASGFGILKMDASGRIVHFDEKPAQRRTTAGLSSDIPVMGRGYPGLDGHLHFPAGNLGGGSFQSAAG